MVAAMAFFWGLVILDERFARGEVDREEYEARKAVLRESAR